MPRTVPFRSAAVLLLSVLAAVGVLTAVFVAPAVAQAPETDRRVALVIGNFRYEHVAELANPGSDATLIATNLQQLGFTLVGGAAQENLDKAHFDHLIEEFGHAIEGVDVALFYYAGHGLEVNGTNWLVPIDADPTRPQDLPFQMVDAGLVLKQMDGSGTRLNIVILDACRNNPFAALGTRGVQGGLAEMRAPEGTLISFATQPGNVAQDGSGADGPYALALVSAMHKPGLDIFRVFNLVGLTVEHETNRAQLPWVSSSPIDGEFYFTPTDATPVLATTLPASTPPASGTPPPATAPSPATGAAAAKTTSAPAKLAANNLGPLRSLAEQGKPAAEVDLGIAYAKGQAIPRDDATARHWFERAAAEGAPKAQYWLGGFFERGRGGPRDYAQALQWYQRAADQGYPPAEDAVARFYGRGIGVARDLDRRTDWYRRAADQGDPFGEWALGNFYQFGNGVPRNTRLALHWYQRAADQGFVFAEIRLGVVYERGVMVRRDYATSLHWFRRAADAGSPVALNAVGIFYRSGHAVPQDYAEAMRLFRQAADKGYATAEFNVGLLYANGRGVKPDQQQARAWFEKAAAQGNQPAIARLARMNAACARVAAAGAAPEQGAANACQNP